MLNAERGASAVLVSASLIMLFGMAAIAIDVGAGFTERRSNQNAADVAAVGGLLWSRIGTTANPLQEGLDQAKAIASTNTGGGITEQQWTDCDDPESLFWSPDNANFALLGVTGGTDCISWNEAFTQLRVKIPVQAIDTTFGRVVGVTELRTSAAAEASIVGLGVGGSLPSGAFGGASGGTEICIKTGTNGHESCGAPSTGDFQNFLPFFYKEVDPTNATTSQCVDGESGPGNPAMSRVVADGLDHFFGTTTGAGNGVRLNGGWCKNPPKLPGPPFPDHVDSSAGYTNADVTFGLILGADFDGPFSGRLDRGPYQSKPVGSADGFEIFDTTIDNLPLWSYILSGGSLHQDCVAVRELPDHPTFEAGSTYAVPANSLGLTDVTTWEESKALMAACLTNESGSLFDTDKLEESPRLATVPRFWQTAPCGSNACTYDIKDFVPVFIQDMWANYTNSWACGGEVELDTVDNYCRHMPGMTGEVTVAAPGQKRISSASAFVLECSHFSEEVCRDVQDGVGGTTTIIGDIELTR